MSDKPIPADGPWYRGGLRFECTQCGDCCTGAPGYVWLTDAELLAMAEYLQITPAAFEERYVKVVRGRKSLIDLPARNWDCVFLHPETRGCTVYPVRPQQCRTWPFWDTNLKSPESWRATCEACPGSGQGKLHSLEAIQTQAAVVKM